MTTTRVYVGLSTFFLADRREPELTLNGEAQCAARNRRLFFPENSKLPRGAG